MFRLFDRCRSALALGDVIGTVIRGAGSALFVNVAATGLALVSQVILARTLGAAEFGIFACAMAWMNVAVLVSTLGTELTLVRFASQYATNQEWPRLRRLLNWSRRLALRVSLVLAGCAAVATLLLRDRLGSGSLLTALAGAASLPLLGLVALNQGALLGLKQVVRSQVPRLVLRPLLLIAGVGPLWLFCDEVGAPAAMVVNGLALLAAVVLGQMWLAQAVPEIDGASAAEGDERQWLRVSLPLFLVSGTNVVLQESGVILIGLVVNPTAAGVYSVAIRVVRLMAFGMAAGGAIAGPLFSELHTRRDLSSLQATSRMTSLIALGGAVACGLVLFAGRWVALGIFGSAFEAGADVIGILALGQLINAAMGPTGELLSMTGHQDAYARILLIVTALNLAGSYWAIGEWGMTGAAAVNSTVLGVQNVWAWYEVRRRLGIDSTPLGLVTAAGR